MTRFSDTIWVDREIPTYSRGSNPITDVKLIHSPSSQSELSPIDPNTYRGLMRQECIGLIERRIREFDEMNEKASDLVELVHSAFHLILLPLSPIATIST